jgi:hypothetical protein
VTAGNGITVTGTTTPTIAASIAAGTGIGISGTTTLSVSNTGVTSIVAGTNVSVSGATGAVTVNAPAYGTTITASTIGGTAAAGTSTGVAREDHKHAFPAGAAPSALTVSSTQATGTSAAPALADHVHAMPGSATAGASAVGDTAATGSAATVALSDHRHGREAFGTPGAVTGGATAASGSATTIARSDHVHSTASIPVLLGRTVLTASASSINFTSISSGFHTLLLYVSGKTTTAATLAYTDVQFNGDTSANYLDQANGSNNAATICGIGYTHGTTNYLSASGALAEAVIYNANSTTEYKTLMTRYVFNNSTSTITNQWGGFGMTQWRSTSAISSLLVLSRYADVFATGTSATLYGLRS